VKVRGLPLSLFLGVMVACGPSQLDGKPLAKVEAVASESKVAAPTAGEVEPAALATPSAKGREAKLASAVVSTGEGTKVAEKPLAPSRLNRPDPLEKAERALVVDAGRSSVGFVGRKLTDDHEGSFGGLEGTAQLKGYRPSELKVTIQTASVSSDHPKLTNHLKGADFFNTAKYPTARFASTKIRPGGEGAATHTITGELSLLAVTKRITFPATIVVTDAGATGLAEFKINRKDFGIVYPGRPDDLIADEVLLKLNLAYLDEKYVR
jgi:polyisoprenoid-binding protein YceI